MKRLIREPLVHFLLLGAGLFLAYGLVNDRNEAEPEGIVVRRSQIEQLAAGFTRTWQRHPSAAELEGLIRDYIREEVCVRQAMALGLDQDDIIIRRRLRQKMEFIAEDVAAHVEPTDEELRKYLEAHAEAFRLERRFTFSQVYLNPDRHGKSLADEAARLLADLGRAGDQTHVAALGDPSLLEPAFESVPASRVAMQFGEEFAATLNELPAGQWHGPVESAYGVHLVYVAERTAGRLPALEEVRDAVRREWVHARRREANEKFYQELLSRYAVTVERPCSAEGEKMLAAMRSQ